MHRIWIDLIVQFPTGCCWLYFPNFSIKICLQVHIINVIKFKMLIWEPTCSFFLVFLPNISMYACFVDHSLSMELSYLYVSFYSHSSQTVLQIPSFILLTLIFIGGLLFNLHIFYWWLSQLTVVEDTFCLISTLSTFLS